MKKTNNYLKAKFVFIFHPPGYSVAPQARKREHEKSYLLEKIWLSISTF